MSATAFLVFCATYFAFSAAPGPSKMMVMSTAMWLGPACGLVFGVGVVTASFACLLVTVAGFATISMRLGELIWLIQFLGAAYLIYRGIVTWRTEPAVSPYAVAGDMPRLFLSGVLLSASNPITPIFYTAALPGFMPMVGQAIMLEKIVTMAGGVGIIEVIVIGGYVAVGNKTRNVLTTSNRLKILNRATGGLLTASGVLIVVRWGLA